MASDGEVKTASDRVREHLERSRSLREQMVRSGNAAVYHLRRAAELRRRAARDGR